ncbi:FAD-dependent oxidoreductase [Lysinibacillus endophyticus]|uniref:NAD(P)/FAD-dependent oxidoreductase n=1 Tax=Ureibacillus endophyticus TaxID=1978490 RepID=UPI003135ED58
MMKCDVVIIGAGPAGLTASIELALKGLQVVIVDENYRSGGRLLGQLYEDRRKKQVWAGKIIAKDLADKAKALSVKFLFDTSVWKIEDKKVFLSNEVVKVIEAKAILLATGAIEKALPIPGWQKVGVVTVGAAQTFTNLHNVKIGQNVIFIGIDPLSISVAIEMKHAGVNVKGLFLPPTTNLLNQKSNPKEVLESVASAAGMATNPIYRLGGKFVHGAYTKLLLHLLKYKQLKINGIPIYFRKAVTQINGRAEVQSVNVRSLKIDGEVTEVEKTLHVDTVCLSGGLLPLIDLSQLANCVIIDIPELGGFVPLHNEHLKTTVEGIYVAGNITGIEGAQVAMAQGKLAARSILREFNLSSENEISVAFNEVEQARNLSPITFLPEIRKGRQIMRDKWEEYLKI